jgi:non-heme chloroperoxidase
MLVLHDDAEREYAYRPAEGLPDTKVGTFTQIFYNEWGQGQPIVFSHGWPLSADDWDAQMLFFLGEPGLRPIG